MRISYPLKSGFIDALATAEGRTIIDELASLGADSVRCDVGVQAIAKFMTESGWTDVFGNGGTPIDSLRKLLVEVHAAKKRGSLD